MFEDHDRVLLQLAIVSVLTLVILYFMLEDIERLKRITSPRLIFVEAPKERAAPERAAPIIEGEYTRGD